MIITISTVLTGCEPLLVLDPKGPQAKTQADDIMLIYMAYVSYRNCRTCYFSIRVN